MPSATPALFDPVRVGRSECAAWAAYYRRDWLRCALGAVGLVRHGFGLGPLRNLRGAWLVLRANLAWAPHPDNDPDAARRFMAGFYRLAVDAGRLRVDPDRAAALEVAWWDVHRRRQRGPAGADPAGFDALLESLVRLYAYVYRCPPEAVHDAAALRVQAMDLSDAWVAAGCRADDPLLAEERLALVASYTTLRDGIERGRLLPG